MSDRYSKIVELADEILHAEHNGTASLDQRTPSPSMLPIKMACLSALAAVIGTSALTYFVQDSAREATRYEQVEIQALLFYTAQETFRPEDEIRLEMKQELKLKDIDKLSAHDYQRARDYLWEKLKS